MDTLEQTNGKPPSKGGIGPVVGIIVIIILLALASLYYFTVGVDQIQQKTEDTTATTPEDEAAVIENISQSSELDAVETDLGATDFSGLDQASANVDASLQTQ